MVRCFLPKEDTRVRFSSSARGQHHLADIFIIIASICDDANNGIIVVPCDGTSASIIASICSYGPVGRAPLLHGGDHRFEPCWEYLRGGEVRSFSRDP